MPNDGTDLFDWERVRRFTENRSAAEESYILRCFHEWRKGNDLLTAVESGDAEEDCGHVSDRELQRLFEGFEAGWAVHQAITGK